MSLDLPDTPTPARAQLPAPTAGPRVAARRRRRRLMTAEAAAAAVLVGVLATVSNHAPPPPVDERQLWLSRAGPSLDALAVEVAHASATPAAPATAAQLLATLAPARRAGPPPDAAAARAWSQALDDTAEAASSTAEARRQFLGEAGLDLVTVEVDMRSG